MQYSISSKTKILLFLIFICLFIYIVISFFNFKEKYIKKDNEIEYREKYKEREEKYEEYNNTLNILNLVLFSPDKDYIEMYKLTRNFYKIFPNLVTVYYTYSDVIDRDYYDENENILYIKGKETYIPGILDKTVSAFQYVPVLEKIMSKRFDYIVRTNISTIVNFHNLNLNGVDYGCGLKNIIHKGYRDPKSGIINDSLEGLKYPSGTCIIFSRDLFYKIIHRLYLIDRSLIDDVSIGNFMSKYFSEYKLKDYSDYFIFTDKFIDDEIDIEKNIFFRNRHSDRKKDIEKMSKIINNILKGLKKRAICLLCASYNKKYLEYVNKTYENYTNEYDIYVCIDKIDTIKSDYKKYKNLNILFIDRKTSENQGFKGSVLYFLDRACSRDKSLYYFCMINKSYEYVWFIEDDVYFKDSNNIKRLDDRYPENIDFLVREHKVKYSKEPLDWHWPHILGKIDLPWASSMICIVRLSKKMLDCIRDYALKNRQLFLDEALFNTIAEHNKLNIENPPEFEHITYIKDYVPKIKRDDYFYHPMKEFWKDL